MAADPIGEDNPIEEILLTGFPNPERVGCPPSQVIAGLGNRELPRDHPAWHHIWNCSPCFRDFKMIRDERVARVEKAEKQQQNRRRFVAASAASLAALCGGYLLVRNSQSKPSREIEIVNIDLSGFETTRGSAEKEASVARLPKHLDEIHVTLPRFSPVGRYVIAILESESESTALALGSATTKGTEQRSTLVVSLDLSDIKTGDYFLGTRPEQHGQQGDPRYYPVTIVG